MPSSSLEGQVPVFVYPASLTFSLQDESTHKQVLTIYNPYDFAVNYLLLCTAPEKYHIPDSSGSLKPRNRVDILIRHIYPISRNVGVSDKLRVQITEAGRTKVLGRKDIPALLVHHIPDRDSHQEADTFETLPHRHRRASFHSPTQQAFDPQRVPSSGGNADRWFGFQVAAIIICLAALMMPTEGETGPTIIPPLLHFSTAFKNVVSFTLGIVVCAILNRQT